MGTGRVGMMLAGVCAMVVTAAIGDSGRGRHAQLYVVPTPGEVSIDGHLDDWDLSGQIEMFVIEATRSTMSAKVAAMYDEDALYISGEVRDPTPMMNRHDPLVNANRGWNADALQFRLVLDPDAEYPVPESSFKYRVANPPEDTRDDITHLILWHYTDDGSANLQMHQGMTFRVPRPGWAPHGLVPYDLFEAEYRKWEGGDGYTFEYRIPWSTLGAERPLRGGDIVAGTVQVNWSRPDGQETGGGSAWSYDVLGKPGFPFQSADTWGRLIFAEEGNVPQEKVLAGVPPERELPLEFAYELPADSIHTTVQLFNEENQAVRVLVAQEERPGGLNRERWDGLDDRGRVLPAGEYQWRGVRADEPLRAQYRFSVHNAGNPAHPTDDNRGGWGSDHGAPQAATALSDGMILGWGLAEFGWGIIRTDLDGRKLWGSKHFAYHLATDGTRLYVAGGGGEGMRRSAGVTLLDVKDARPVRYPDGTAVLRIPGGEDEEDHASGLAYADGVLYASFGSRDLIGAFNAETGALQAQWSVAAPQRLAVTPEGGLLVVSEGKVLRVQGAGAGSTAIDSHRQPSAAVEMTEWISAHLDDPQGIAVGADGTIFVANRGARQNVSVFAADGTYLRSVGKSGGRPAVGGFDPEGMRSAAGLALDAKGRLWVAEDDYSPKRISVWDAEAGNHIKEFFGSSDYFAYGFIDRDRPDEIFANNVLWKIDWDAYTSQPISTIWRKTGPNHAPGPNADAHTSGGGFRMHTTEDGRQFGWGGAGNTRGLILYMRVDGDIFRPVAGVIDPWRDRYPALEPYKEAAHHRTPRKLFWSDVAGNGEIALEEVSPMADMGHSPDILWVSKDLTLYFTNGQLLRPSATAADGRPIYDFAQIEVSPQLHDPLARGFLMVDADGSAYTLAHRDGPSLIGWTPEGEMLWNYPDLIDWRNSMNLPILKPGRLWAMTRPMGIAGDYFAHQTYMGMNQVFRKDGTYIGGLLSDGRLGGRGAYEGQPEGQGGAFVRLPLGGEERYFIIHGGQDTRVWEVLGLDAMEDLPGGRYVHREQDAAAAAAALAAYEAALAGQREVRIVPGGLEALATAPAVVREMEGARGFEARLAYDADSLHVRFDVQSPHELVNNQSEPQIVFRGGNLLDIQIATDPEADPERETPAPGDVRLLVTRQQGQPFAVLFEPKVAGFTGTPIILTSPTGEESFDRITVVDQVKLDYEKTADGFTATVSVPQSLLGLALRPGLDVRLDLGYVFGNNEGTRTAIRAYLFTDTFTANVVDDIPHESRLEPAEWGRATVE